MENITNDASDVEIKSDGIAESDRLILLPGKIVRKNGALAFKGPLAQFFLTVAMGKAVWLHKVSESEEICVGINSKFIRTDDSSLADTVVLSGVVENVGAGADAAYLINVRLEKYSLTIKHEGDSVVSRGDRIKLQFARNRAALFRCRPEVVELDATPLAFALA